jgi:uncharacterized protein (UPF0276 family)
LRWLREIEPRRITQLHIVGYSRSGDRYMDSHSAPIQDELLELARAVVRYASVKAIILELDGDFPAAPEMQLEMNKLERIRGCN